MTKFGVFLSSTLCCKEPCMGRYDTMIFCCECIIYRLWAFYAQIWLKITIIEWHDFWYCNLKYEKIAFILILLTILTLNVKAGTRPYFKTIHLDKNVMHSNTTGNKSHRPILRYGSWILKLDIEVGLVVKNDLSFLRFCCLHTFICSLSLSCNFWLTFRNFPRKNSAFSAAWQIQNYRNRKR